jgi:hypothetical protein
MPGPARWCPHLLSSPALPRAARCAQQASSSSRAGGTRRRRSQVVPAALAVRGPPESSRPGLIDRPNRSGKLCSQPIASIGAPGIWALNTSCEHAHHIQAAKQQILSDMERRPSKSQPDATHTGVARAGWRPARSPRRVQAFVERHQSRGDRRGVLRIAWRVVRAVREELAKRRPRQPGPLVEQARPTAEPVRDDHRVRQRRVPGNAPDPGLPALERPGVVGLRSRLCTGFRRPWVERLRELRASAAATSTVMSSVSSVIDFPSPLCGSPPSSILAVHHSRVNTRSMVTRSMESS